MKLNRRKLVGAASTLVLVVAIGVTAVRNLGKPEAPDYIVDTARIGDVEAAVLATGTLQPLEVVLVGSEVSGEIIAMPVKLGDVVAAGQVIAEIDARRQRDTLRDRESQLAADRLRLTSFQANLEMAERNLARQQTLKANGLASQDQYDRAMNDVRQRKAQLDNFQKGLVTSEIRVEDARDALAKATIRAPTDGVIAEVVSGLGATLNANRETPTIVKLAKMKTMTVRAQVSEADIGKVRAGQKVYFTILGEPDRRRHATLRTREITPAGGILDPNAASGPKTAIYYNALFDVPNEDRTLLPAMTAEVHVVLDEVSDVVTVPMAALDERTDDGAATVRVLAADGTVEERQVTVGLTNASVAEVKSGVRPGEQVVIGEG